ncbi:MAG: ATP-binding protein [Betaproteobacteria bacterium]
MTLSAGSAPAIATKGREPPSADSAEIERLVAADQMRLVMSYMSVGTLVATLFALVLASYAQRHIGGGLVLGWVAIKLVTAVPRIIQAYLYHHRGRGAMTQFWQTSVLGLLALDGLSWGLAGAWVAVESDVDLVAVLSASLCCVASVATFGLQVRTVATAAYVVPILAPTSLGLLSRGDGIGTFAGASLLILLGLLMSTARRSERRIVDVLKLRFEMDRLAHEREEALTMAQRQSLVKSQFLAAMSHEFRTPLHGILGLTRVTRAECKDEQIRHRLGMIQHSGEHLLRLINDLLDMARIEAGHIEINPVAFDLALVLDELVNIYGIRCQEKRLEFVANFEFDEAAAVVGDSTRLQQVLHNLLGNAVKFTDKGCVELRVRRADGTMVEFSVADTGPGIRSEDKSNLFEAFSQVGARSKRAAGTGLGLHISREIARAMGGSIAFESQFGRGSIFTVTVPLPALERPAETRQDSSWAVGDAVQTALRVLLAEDNEVNAVIVHAMLTRHGFEVAHVRDGEEAVRQAMLQPRPDVVLMDCQMPEMDGIQATQAIRRLESQSGMGRVPVIALTANNGPEDRAECMRAGMDYFLPKPFNERELFAAIGACAPAQA